jgi:5'-3' exonuclease
MIVVIDFSNLVWSTFYSSLRINKVEAETCPTHYQGHVDFFHQKLVSILQGQPCHEYFFALDKRPINKYRIFADYKKSRSKISFDPKPAIFDILAGWNCNFLYSEDNEADDVIASFVGSRLEEPITVASSDKDLWQLLEFPNTKVYNFHGNKFVNKVDLMTAYELDDFAHVKMHKTLWGDSSDNVPNLLPRTQKQLLPLIKQSDGSLRDFFRVVDLNKDSLTPKCLQMIDDNRNLLKTNYELVRLNFDCEVIKDTASAIRDMEAVEKEARKRAKSATS